MDRCFACDRKLGKSPQLVRVHNETTLVYVGRECYKLIQDNPDGYQPPKGGPRLHVIGGTNE